MLVNPECWPEGLYVRPGLQTNAPRIVLLHGLGASREDLAPIANFVDPEKQYHWIFPNAPELPVTLNGGRGMRAWYDIFGLDKNSEEDAAGMLAMAARLGVLLDHESGDFPLLLGGFSQGGAMSLYTAFHQGYPVSGVLALSAYLPLRQQLPRAEFAAPVFWGHGRSDSVLPLSYMEIAREMMASQGYLLHTHIYPMDHSICEEELVDMQQFIRNTLTSKKSEAS